MEKLDKAYVPGFVIFLAPKAFVLRSVSCSSTVRLLVHDTYKLRVYFWAKLSIQLKTIIHVSRRMQNYSNFNPIRASSEAPGTGYQL